VNLKRGSNTGPRANSTPEEDHLYKVFPHRKDEFSNNHNFLAQGSELSMEAGIGKVLNSRIKLFTQKIDLTVIFSGNQKK
jgi:hypothetical protein